MRRCAAMALLFVACSSPQRFDSGAGAAGGNGATTSGNGGGTTAGGCSGVCGTAGCGACPDAGRVQGPGYAIDRTEVTNAEYASFLASGPSTRALPDACGGTAGFTPANGWPGEGDLPVVFVTWCQAWGYCHWAGGRLCGAIDGGSSPFESYADATVSAWYNACSEAGARAFPYGDSYDETACNTYEAGLDHPAPVGSFPRCDGGLAGVVDLSGNVWEWEDSCDGNADLQDNCRQRGGSYADEAVFNRCDFDQVDDRGDARDRVGFRCCSP